MLLEEHAPVHRHVKCHDPRFGVDGVVGLVAISALGWGRDLGSIRWRGYSVKSCKQWLIDGGERLEKKDHATMCDWRKK
jgi:hypothetical protein